MQINIGLVRLRIMIIKLEHFHLTLVTVSEGHFN